MRLNVYVASAMLVSSLVPAAAADLVYDPPAVADPVAPGQQARSWEFVFAPYLLAPTIQGDAQIGRLPSTSLDVSPGTIFENLQFGAMAHFEVLYNRRWGATLDIAYMDLGSATTLPRAGGTVKSGVKQLVTEAFFGYRFWQENRNWAEAYAGARWWHNDLDITAAVPAAGFSRTITEDWVDPVIGVRGQYFFSPAWSVYGSGNIGGFGLVSDFTWAAQGGLGYHFNERYALHLQYKATGVDYDNGKSGVGSFSYDTVTHGPMLGFAVRF
ncbi:hypothetical protein JM93_01042 [Roseibium hamelinense]|uniref:Outer membrane protein beta-barrel domain-containing protein n=1 Tax=Roseibium hamelinense TaxID=150831 RepID=A0A562TB18_9HYPH|nr:hypothetical protein [Roseibium hamelinense]MTI45557.1 hypothetical protein [Roseibium hamelinense]TWI90066.1 hypothetical protein JM93_01042 [Roseibium hamelinense]